jgi:arabinofuranosyltransferase
MQRESNLDRYDLFLVVGTILVVGQFILLHLDYSLPPSEDAAILMRYSQHLAQGHGIVWNVGEKPVEGATDFLFMGVLAAMAKAGCTLEAASRVVGFLSHLLTVGLVYLGIRAQTGSSRLLAFCAAAYIGMGPAVGYIEACFGTPFFALFAALTCYAAIRTERNTSSRRDSLMFAFSGLFMALIRPEGAFLAVFMLIAIVFGKGFKESRTVSFDFALIFLLIGGTYFLWRWHYFGYLLPNPFYKKGGGHIYWSSLEASARNVVTLGGPFLLAYAFGLCRPRTRRRTIFALIPVVGYTFLWILLSDDMNYMMRFQYAILPVVLLSWPPLLEGSQTILRFFKWQQIDLRTRRLLQVLVGLATLWVVSYRGEAWASQSPGQDFNYDIAEILSRYKDKGYTLATTEAGLLPLYSKWRTVDMWGLNNPWIAHHGAVTQEYLQERKPEVIEFHASFSPVVQPAQDPTWPSPAAWYSMLMTIKSYAESNGYCLAAVYGTGPRNSYYYYVRSDFPDSARITSEIRSLADVWKSVGWRVHNFAGQ